MTQYFAPDTNFFLQCKPPGELAWDEVTDAQHIVLVVVREVQRELDRAKSGGNTRRAQRSRKASTSFRNLVAAQVSESVLCDASPRVILCLMPALDPNRERPAGLDFSSSDEKVIEEIFACKVAQGWDLTLLTHDTVPVQVARDLGLSAKFIPDSWLLPPEPSSVDREIAQLKRQIASLQSVAPQVNVSVRMSGQPAEKIEGSTNHFLPASAQFVESATAKILAVHPRHTRASGLRNVSMTMRHLAS